MVVDIDDTGDLQSLEVTPQLNHVYNKVNGDLENDVDAVNTTNQRVPVSANAMQRQSSVGGSVTRPVNGLKTHEHNIILLRMAIVEVKKPGKGNTFCRYENRIRYFVICVEL